MKKLLILFVAFALTFTLAGCDSTELTDKMNELDSSITEQIADITALEGDLADLEADLMAAQSELDALEAEQADPAELERATSKVLALQSEIENIYSELYVHNKRLETLEDKYTEGVYEPGIYEGSYATADGTYLVTVAVDRNGKIAGYHADFVSIAMSDDKEDPIVGEFTLNGIEYMYPTTYKTGDYTLDTVTYKQAADMVDAREYTLGYTAVLGDTPTNEAIHMKKEIAGTDGWVFEDVDTDDAISVGDKFVLESVYGNVTLTMTAADAADGAFNWHRTAGTAEANLVAGTFSVTGLTAASDEANSLFAMLPAGTDGWAFTDVNTNDLLDAGDTFAMTYADDLEGEYGTVTITVTDAPVADDPLTEDVDETAGAKGTATYMWTEDPEHNFRPTVDEVFEAQVAGVFTVEDLTATLDSATDVFADYAAGTSSWVYVDVDTSSDVSVGDTYTNDDVVLTVTVLPVEDDEDTTDVDETVLMEADGVYAGGLFTAEGLVPVQDYEQKYETVSAYLTEEAIDQAGIDMAMANALAGEMTELAEMNIDVVEMTSEGMYNPGVYVIELDMNVNDTDVNAYLAMGDTVLAVVFVDENGHYLGTDINVLRKRVADASFDLLVSNPTMVEAMNPVADTDDVFAYPELDYPEVWMRTVFGVDELELRMYGYYYSVVEEYTVGTGDDAVTYSPDVVYYDDELYAYEDQWLLSAHEKFMPNATGGYDHLVFGTEAADDVATTDINEATEDHWYPAAVQRTFIEAFPMPMYVAGLPFMSVNINASETGYHEESINFDAIAMYIDGLFDDLSDNDPADDEMALATKIYYTYIITPLTEEVVEEEAAE